MKNRLTKILVPALLTAPLSVVAGDFDGSKPLLCASLEINECIPGEGCELVTAASVDAPQFLKVDFDKKVITTAKSGGEQKKSAIKRSETVDGKLMLQGAEDGIEGVSDGVGWTLSISTETGRTILSGSGEKFGFVIFGACTVL